ncbi:unnamed protein product [Pieris macdunnoughi]|uniref:Uncharacterized protein n=1 Tax=Pieris macdunnoughi TaxID=345717 RepID=A0A821TLA3_9NEOP|nr:unnamed protein product [Pieris macdunnoughi]
MSCLTIEEQDFEASQKFMLSIEDFKKDANGKRIRKIEDRINNGNSIEVWSAEDKKEERQKLYCKVNFLQDEVVDNGVVCKQEFIRSHVALGIPKHEVKETFRKIAYRKSHISWEEFETQYKLVLK